MINFTDKVALVTGGAQGMGAETVRSFARHGAAVAVVDLRQDAAQALADEVIGAGGRAIAVAADVSDEEQVAAMVARVVDEFGRLDAAVNNAAVPPDNRHLHELDVAEFHRVLNVDLLGVALCLKYELLQMREQGSGAIVNIGSVSSRRPQARNAAYVAAKHGVAGLTKVAALENSPLGIRVNTVMPGAIETPMLKHSLSVSTSTPEQVAARLTQLGRFGLPEEVGRTSVWLCSDAASFITGVEVPVDGGYIAQ